MTTTTHRYRIDDLQGAPIATMSIVQAIAKPDDMSYRGCTGRVTVELEYVETSSGSTKRVKAFPFDGQWFPLSGTSFSMRIGNFNLSPELVCRGIGTLCWSKIHETLPFPPSYSLVLDGKLSDRDATITGMILGKNRTINNTERRNAFWRRMLDPADLTFVPSEDGGGYFRGRFVDPAAHSSYIAKAIATKI
ncbi:hypothetical protein [Burkholderia contaminans]|uniref:hypothetical protein n=1 Tax=Burkholderia contaminans TaxID=488447 RepID=UPI003D6756C7